MYIHLNGFKGDMAAALVRSPDGDENWILAEVVTYNQTTGRYEVDDIDEEQKDRHALSRRKVIPLPTRRACPETNPEALYEPGKIILLIHIFLTTVKNSSKAWVNSRRHGHGHLPSNHLLLQRSNQGTALYG